MSEAHPFQKHLCVLFLSMALIATYISLKHKLNKNVEHLLNFTTVSSMEIEEYLQFLDLKEGGLRIAENAKASSRRLYLNLTTNLSNYETKDDKPIIYILGLFELSTRWGIRFEGYSEISAAQLAVKHINYYNIIPGYLLKLLINDTKCDPGVGIDTFFHSIYSNQTIMMLLGTSCSNVTESLAHVVPYWNILQMSFGSTSPSLSDRKKFPLFFRTVAPDSSHNIAKISFIKHFQWNVVATFSQSENTFLLPLNNLITELENSNVTCVATITFSLDNYKEQLKVLKDSDIRIIIGSFSANLAPKIFCEVYELNMYGADYVWILQDQQKFWWDNSSDCISLKLMKSVEGILLVRDFNMVSENETSISGLTNEMFKSELNISKYKISKYAKFTYDAIWAMALTLRETQSQFKNGYLKNFNYKRKDMTCNFVRKMSSLNFMGLSGPVKFIGADRIGNSALLQLQNGKLNEIAIFDSNINRLDFNCKFCIKIKWQNGQIPIAQRILKVSLITIPKEIFFSIFSISILGITVSLLFLYFNLHFRRVKSVKLSSPKLNNVAVIGCILVYSSVILLGFDTITFKSNQYFNVLCTIRVYLLSAGFSLAFGSMFAKTYRVHRIFTYCGGTSKVKDKLLKDKQLIALILIPILIDAMILTLWVMIDPMQRQLHNLTLEINSFDRGVVYQKQVEVCRSQNTSGWFLAIYGYKGLILIMGVYMAWETRHIKVQALNDSQYIGICVYSAVFSAIIVVLSSLVSEYVILSYLARTISILASTTITLFLLFLPKLRSVFHHVGTQDPIMQSMGLKIEYNTRRLASDDPKELIYRLEIQNKVYKCELNALDKEIERLENLISNSSSTKSSCTQFEIYAINSKSDKLQTASNNLRASWPNAFGQFIQAKNLFHSENKLDNNDMNLEKFSIFSKLKRIFTSIPSISFNNIVKNDDNKKLEKQKSNPEFYKNYFPVNEHIMKAKSEISLMDKH